jgi:hypothetical protein
MSVTSPTDPRPLPIGVTEGQQFMENHLQIFRSGATANGLGGPINFSSEVANKQPRNLFEHVDDEYRELGMRRYRCAYFFNSHYTLSIPNLVVYIKANSVNTKSHIAFSFGTSGIKGVEPSIATQFSDPPNITFNSAQARQQAYFLPVALKPRDWIAFWIREILDFEAQTTENNYFAIRAEAKDPIAITPTADFNIVFTGNMGCGSNFDNILGKMKARSPSAYFFLGNMSYGPTGDCWINKVANLRPVYITFGAYDWYHRQYADRIDDDPYPRVPPEWYWPTLSGDDEDLPECDDDLWDEWNVQLTEDTKEEDDPEDQRWELKGPSLEMDDNDNPVEATIGEFATEINAKYYLEYLRSCEIFTNDVDRDRFNESLQNQYRSRFGLNAFEGYQAYYIGNAFFLILNSNAVPFGHIEDSPQYQFAARQLKQANDNAYVAYKIVLAYRPGYIAPNGTLRAGPEGQTAAGGYQGPIERFNATYKPLFEEHKVTLYINGNVMNYQRTGILKFQSNNWFAPTEQSPGSGPSYKLRDKSLEGSGIIYLTVGTGGAALQNNETLPSWMKKSIVSFGYLLMTSVGNGQSIELRFYDINDQLQDFFTVGVD